MSKLLKPYYYEIQAVRITRDNFKELKKLDTGDGVLEEGNMEDFIGDWFVLGTNGYELMPGYIKLLPAKPPPSAKRN